MSTKFYIKDDNGSILSVDGKTRYTLLEGKAAYDFLQTDNGRKRQFFVDVDENGDKLGVEAEPVFIKKHEPEMRRKRYLDSVKVECKITFVSGNTCVEDTDNAELFDTIEDETADVFEALYAKEEIEILHKAIASLSPQEKDLLAKLFFSKAPMSEKEYAELHGISQQAVSKRKLAIFEKIKKFF